MPSDRENERERDRALQVQRLFNARGGGGIRFRKANIHFSRKFRVTALFEWVILRLVDVYKVRLILGGKQRVRSAIVEKDFLLVPTNSL